MSLITILTSAATKLPKTVLASLGIGIISFASVFAAFTALLSLITTGYSGLGSDMLAYAQLSGLTTGLGTLLGAWSARISITQISKLGLLNGLSS